MRPIHAHGAAGAPGGVRALAALLLAVGAAVGVGGALEFRYFGPATAQFWAGVVATPAGALAVWAAVRLWRHGAAARPVVQGAGVGLLAAAVVGGGLRVMGPPAILLALLGGGTALWWARRQRDATG